MLTWYRCIDTNFYIAVAIAIAIDNLQLWYNVCCMCFDLIWLHGFCLGGVTSMDPFLLKFFPSVYRKKNLDKSSNKYCQYDSQILTMFTSSLYLAALLSSLVASSVTRRFGRKLSMFFGGLLFLIGALVNGFAQQVWMLIVGRILLGFGIGFANQVYIVVYNFSF